jgi:putative ATP-binding cassette transporter
MKPSDPIEDNQGKVEPSQPEAEARESESVTNEPGLPVEASKNLDDVAALRSKGPEDDELKNLDPDDRKALEKELLIHRFLSSAKGFWGHAGDRLAWLLSGSLLLFVLVTIGAQYGINLWNRHIFDALEKKDSATVLWLSAIFFPLAAATVTFGVVNVYVRMSLQRRWRAWLTDNVLTRWLNNGHYYQLNLISGDHQNPEYRIAEDVRISTDAPVDFVHGVVTASLSALTFIVVLSTLAPSH